MSDGRSADRLRHVGGDAVCLAGFDILNLEVTAIGDSLYLLDAGRIHRRFDRGNQKTKVDDLVANLLLGDHLVLRVHSKLDVIADADFGRARHGAGVRIGQRDLVFAAAIQFLQHSRVPGALVPDRRDLLGELAAGAAAFAVNMLLLGIAVVEAFHVIGQLLVGLTDELRQSGTGKIAVFVIDRRDARAVHSEQLALQGRAGGTTRRTRGTLS